MTTSQPTSPAQSDRMASAAGWATGLLLAAVVCGGAARLGDWHGPLGAGQLAYGLGLGGVTLAGWRWWCRRSAAVRAEPVAEPARVLLVALVALGVMVPLFTSQLVGGTDARWYAFMLHDFIEQWRAGGPPVFLGQGEYVWNGAVHPFRSAPVYMHVAGLWDWVTLRSLGAEALQHLAAITAALAGAGGMYAAGVALAPRRRWEAAGIAAIYACSSGGLYLLYRSDAYMTYMASAVFAVVFYGNARVLVEGRGWMVLAAGLALAWMSHPPTALQVTLLTGFLQTAGLAFGRGAWVDWRRAAGGGVVFGLLAAYYFTGMSELPHSPGGGEMRMELVQVGGLLLGWLAAAQIFLMKRGWPWLLGLLGALAALGLTCQPWAVWLALLGLFLGCVRLAAWRWPRIDPAPRAPLVMLAGILLTAWAMDGLMRTGPLARPGYPQASLEWADAWTSMRFESLAVLLKADTILRPGWGLGLAGLLTGVVALRRRDLATQLWFGAIVLMSPFVLYLPRAGDFIVEYIPTQLRIMTAAPMHLRTIPVLIALLAVGALLALRAEPPGNGRTGRGLLAGVLLLAVGWYGWQGWEFVRHGLSIASSPELSARNRRTENAPMDRFVYDLQQLPSYFSHGKMDPRLEVRLLADNGNLIYGPPQMAEAMEAAGAKVIGLDTVPVIGASQWLNLEPRIVLQPGEHRLLRFDFDAPQRIAGYLIMASEHGYREYLLPASGMARAFGIGPGRSRLLSLWNSGTTPENYQLQFLTGPDNELVAGQHFATVTGSAFRPDLSLIEVKSLNPWRAETRLPWSGQLETPRVYLPGYEVRVDGRRLGAGRISASPDRLLQIAMPPGEHTVEVRYVGTGKLRAAGIVSLAAWALLLGVLIAGPRWRGAERLVF